MGDCNCSTHWLLAAIALGLYFFRKYMKGGQFTENVSAVDKVAVVTGANTGIGLETVRELNIRGAKVYMLCRSEQRASAARNELIKDGCDGSRLIYVNCDLGSKDNIRKCAEKLSKLETRIDILVNNAGLWAGGYQNTADGHELTWGTNYLGPFLFTELLLPLVEKAPEGRIVNVSSLGHSWSPALDFATIDSSNGFDAQIAYCKTKLANIMHARELTRRLRSRGNTTVTVNSLHPGAIPTEIFRDMGAKFQILAKLMLPFSTFFMKSWKDGAQTSIYCALSSEVKGVSGKYFADCAVKKEDNKELTDLACKQLYDYSIKAVGLA